MSDVIRVKIGKQWESVDIADSSVPIDQPTRWLRCSTPRELDVLVWMILLGGER